MAELSSSQPVSNVGEARCPMSGISSNSSFPIMSCDHCGKSDNLFKCSSCKLAQYCDRNCQRAHWATHKHLCKRNAEESNNKHLEAHIQTPPTGMKCPFKPTNISNANTTPGICPYKDSVEDGRVTLLVRQKLDDGVNGMKELACLAKSGKMAITEPLLDAFEEVLRIAEQKIPELSLHIELVLEV